MWAIFPRVAEKAGAVFFTMQGADAVPHVWQADQDGGNPTQITQGGGEFVMSAAPDASSILLLKVDEAGLWLMRLPAGALQRVSEPRTFGSFAPDGRSLLIQSLEESAGIMQPGLQIRPVDGSAPERNLPAPETPPASLVFWSPSGDAVTYVREVDGVQNIWSRPFSGGEPHPITQFREGQIFAFAWSADGKEILVSRGEVQTDVVLLTDFR
jgi:Tol biopolymer transport system component